MTSMKRNVDAHACERFFIALFLVLIAISLRNTTISHAQEPLNRSHIGTHDLVFRYDAIHSAMVNPTQYRYSFGIAQGRWFSMRNWLKLEEARTRWDTELSTPYTVSGMLYVSNLEPSWTGDRLDLSKESEVYKPPPLAVSTDTGIVYYTVATAVWSNPSWWWIWEPIYYDHMCFGIYPFQFFQVVNEWIYLDGKYDSDASIRHFVKYKVKNSQPEISWSAEFNYFDEYVTNNGTYLHLGINANDPEGDAYIVEIDWDYDGVNFNVDWDSGILSEPFSQTLTHDFNGSETLVACRARDYFNINGIEDKTTLTTIRNDIKITARHNYRSSIYDGYYSYHDTTIVVSALYPDDPRAPHDIGIDLDYWGVFNRDYFYYDWFDWWSLDWPNLSVTTNAFTEHAVNAARLLYATEWSRCISILTVNPPIWIPYSDFIEPLPPIDAPPVSIEALNVDVKPGCPINTTNPNSNGVLQVAVISNEEHNASSIDPTSIRFGPNTAEPVHVKIRDVDKDGLDDIILHFRTKDIAIEDSLIDLVAETYDKELVAGVGEARLVPPEDPPDPPDNLTGKDNAPGQVKEHGESAKGKAKGKNKNN